MSILEKVKELRDLTGAGIQDCKTALSENNEDIAATVNYGFEVVAGIQRDNIFATQFHPEKSQDPGLSILKTFFEINA